MPDVLTRRSLALCKLAQVNRALQRVHALSITLRGRDCAQPSSLLVYLWRAAL